MGKFVIHGQGKTLP